MNKLPKDGSKRYGTDRGKGNFSISFGKVQKRLRVLMTSTGMIETQILVRFSQRLAIESDLWHNNLFINTERMR